MFKIGNKVKFKKSSIDTGMIDAIEDDVFTIFYVEKCYVMLEEQGSWWNVNHFEHLKEEIMQEQVVENQAIDWEGSQIDWQVGQEVFCVLRGKGVIANIIYGSDYPIEVKFEKDFEYYTNDGKLFNHHKNRNLFFSEPVITAELFPPKKPFVPKLKSGDMVVVNSHLGSIIHSVKEETETVLLCNGKEYIKSDINSVYNLGEEIIFK